MNKKILEYKGYNKVVTWFLMTIITISLGLLLFTSITKRNGSIYAQNGVLDLTNYDLPMNEPIYLNGEWEFYWHKLLTYNELENDINRDVLHKKVPSVWNFYKINEQVLNGNGYATYRLKIMLPIQIQDLALLIPSVSTAYRLYINDIYTASNGVVGSSSELSIPEYKPQIIKVIIPNDTSKEFDLIIQVSNFTYARGGLWNPIVLGTPEQILNLSTRRLAKDEFILGIIFVMCLFFIFLFINEYKLIYLYYILGCILCFIRTYIYSDIGLFGILPTFPMKQFIFLEYLTLYWSPVVSVLIVDELFDNKKNCVIVKGLFVYASLLTGLSLVVPIRIYTEFTYLYEIIIILFIIYDIFLVLKAKIENKKGASLMILGTSIFFGLIIIDILYQNGIINSRLGEFSSTGFCYIIFIQSIILATNQAETLNEVKNLSSRLLSLDKLKDEFLTNTTHELKTPVNAIIGITENLMQNCISTLSIEQYEALSIVHSSSNRLKNLINDILDVSQFKRGEIKLNLTAVNLNWLISRIEFMFLHIKDNNDKNLKIHIKDDLPMVLADEDRLIQVFYNLIENAWKYSTSGEIYITATEKKQMIEISVEDHGIGIPDNELDYIFLPFYRTVNPQTRSYVGLGLGLSISKLIVELHKGNIYVESKLDIGSKFSFTLPKYDHGIQMIIHDKSPESSNLSFKNNYYDDYFNKDCAKENNKETILVIDNDIANQQAIIGILKLDGYSVLIAKNETIAMNIVDTNTSLCLVIVDLYINNSYGYDLCKKIRKMKSHYELPILMISRKNKSVWTIAGLEAGANDFLSKPFDTGELRARVNTLIELKKSFELALNAEIMLLHSQIKPHFIHNALNTIISVSREDSEKARELLVNFSNYLRRCFDFKNLYETIPINKELEHVRSYLVIEQARFEDKLTVEYDIKCHDFNLPPLILQPIVENAILHGIRPKNDGGVVTIRIYPKDANIVIKIRDNGMGMSEDKILSIMNSGANERRVGLYNINQRLKKIYGTQLVVRSKKGQGTTVQFEIPFQN